MSVEVPPYVKLECLPGFILNRTALAMKNEFEKNLKDLDITAVQFGILKRLWEEDSLSQKEIAKRAFKTTAEIKHIIDKLEKKGFITRQSSLKDKREYKICLTQKGRDTENLSMEIVKKTMEQALVDVSKEEVDSLMFICNKIFANLV